MSLAIKLKELRQKKNQTLQQVADGVNVSKAHIWELEKGTSTNPGLDLLKKLAEHFDVTIAFLSDENTDLTEANALQFFRQFKGKLSETDWEVLRTVAKGLKNK